MSINQNQNKEIMLHILKQNIVILNQDKIKLTKDKIELENRLKHYITYEEKYSKASKKIEELNKKYEDLFVQKEKEINGLKSKYDELEHEREKDLQKYNTNISIYNQKMSLVHQIEMENEIYRKEVKELREENDKLKNAAKAKMESLEIYNSIKFNNLKKKTLNNLNEAKNNVSKLNLKYMDIHSQLSILHNYQLLTQLEYFQQSYDKLKEENKKLLKKISDLNNDIEVHRKTEINLVLKIKEKENDENPKESNFKKYKCNSLNKFNTLSNYNNNSGSLTHLTNHSSNIFQKNPPDIKKSKILNNQLSYKDNLTKIHKKENSYGILPSKSSTSYDNFLPIKERENNFSRNGSGSKNQISVTSGPEINYTKFNKMIKKKNEEIENLKMKIDNLNDKFNKYFTKYKGLFNFLEDCLNEFFNDDEILNIKNVNINIEDIKKFDFSIFNKEEKYSILILLMNYLMKILTFNYKSNLENPLFITNNINIINKKFNSTQRYLNDNFLKKAFIKKNNRLLNEFFLDKGANNAFSPIPIIKKYNSPDDYRLLDNRFKTLV